MGLSESGKIKPRFCASAESGSLAMNLDSVCTETKLEIRVTRDKLCAR